jgi:hypothetical protein
LIYLLFICRYLAAHGAPLLIYEGRTLISGYDEIKGRD